MSPGGVGPMVAGVTEYFRIAIIALLAVAAVKMLARVVKPLAPIAAFL